MDDAKKTSKGSTTSTPILPLWDEPHGSLKRCVPVSELADLKKRMVAYCEEEHLWKLQEEQELQDALANTKHDAEMTGKGSTWTV